MTDETCEQCLWYEWEMTKRCASYEKRLRRCHESHQRIIRWLLENMAELKKNNRRGKVDGVGCRKTTE